MFAIIVVSIFALAFIFLAVNVIRPVPQAIEKPLAEDRIKILEAENEKLKLENLAHKHQLAWVDVEEINGKKE